LIVPAYIVLDFSSSSSRFYQELPQYTLDSLLKSIGTVRTPPGDLREQNTEEDGYTNDACPSLIKIAGNGSELGILQGGEETLRTCRPVLFLENNVEEEHSAAVVDFLFRLDYQPFWKVESLYNENNYFQSTFSESEQLEGHDSVSIHLFCLPAKEVSQHLEIVELLRQLGLHAVRRDKPLLRDYMHTVHHTYGRESSQLTSAATSAAAAAEAEAVPFTTQTQIQTQTLKQKEHSRRMLEGFSEVYANQYWGPEGGRSGPGSDLHETVAIRTALPLLVQEYNITTLLDAPCGSFHWMHAVLPLMLESNSRLRYEGADIVPFVIKDNQQRHPDVLFFQHDIVHDDVPKQYDLIMTRDVFFHLRSDTIFCALQKFQASRSTYLLTTTSPRASNSETESWTPRSHVSLDTGAYREVNLLLPPYNFPEPVSYVHESVDRGLGLWRLDDIPTFVCNL
jgi:hypothetical protein